MTPPHPRRLGVEPLEGRLTPAGNVTASLVGGQLTVVGDDAANDIRVIQSGSTLTITGQVGTTVNGSASATFSADSLSKAEFTMRGGDDHVFLIALRASNDVVIEMADGDDIVEVSNVRTGNNLTVKGGQGDDLFGVANTTVGGDLNAELDEGEATLFLTRMNIAKNLSVITKDQDDLISIDGAITVGEDLTIETGKGDDIVTVADLVTAAPVSVGKSLSIDTDEGNDRVTLVDVVAGEDVNVSTGKGDDTVRLTDVNSGKSVTVNA